MPLDSGQTLTHYEILSPLGVGGMGEVYRARDTRLDREVAIKVLPEAFAEDLDRLRRFEREAKTLATLHHPNIASIFGIDQVGNTCFLALELVPGEDLGEVLKQGPLPLPEALDVGRQIAEGLEAAHEAGVVHRDLKPANVIRTSQGVVKLLDFGLAKPLREKGSNSSVTAKPDSYLVTEEGMVLGTPTYMSPEQARAKPVDRRTDIWAFGCVLYECLTGKRAFGGEAVADILGAIIGADPDFAALPAGTPRSVRELLARCFEKDPRRRLRDIGEARLVLEGPVGADVEKEEASRPNPLPWLVTLVLAVALGAALLSRRPAEEPATRAHAHLSIRLPALGLLPMSMGQEEQGFLTISPDGSRVAFAMAAGTEQRLAVRELNEFGVRELPGTEDASSPFFSPDGRWLGYFAFGRLWKVSVDGGAPIELCESGLDRGGAWGPDGTIVFCPSTASPLMGIPEGGGTPREVSSLDPEGNERSHRWPAFLPGGKEVLFTVGTTDSPGDYEDSKIDAVSLETGARRTLIQGASFARVSSTGHLLYSRGEQVYCVRLDEAEGDLSRTPKPLLRGVAGLPASGIVFFDIAADGTLVYAEADPSASEFELAWIERDGTVEVLPFPPREYNAPRVSPDGTRLAVGIGPGRGRASDIWIGDFATGGLTRLTFDGQSSSPVWSPDGERVAFVTTFAMDDCFGWKPADGSDETQVLMRFEGSPQQRLPLGFTPDGKLMLFQSEGGPGRSNDIYYLSLEDGVTKPVAAGAPVEWAGALSPDGTHVAWGSDASGTPEIYVQRFPEIQGFWQVSNIGNNPRWSPDGKEIIYTNNRSVMSVPITTQPSFKHSPARELYQAPFRSWFDTLANYDVAPDGRLLVVRSTSEESMEGHLNVILNALDGVAAE